MKTAAGKNIPIKLVLTLVFIAAGVVIAIMTPFNGLSRTGHIMMGSLIAALAVWIFQPGGGTLFIGAVIILFGGSFTDIPMSVIANGYSSPSLWLLIPAMFLGGALLNTGLGKRIVLSIFKRMNLSYVKILIGWFFVGLFFSLLTPSITVRISILAPIAAGVADACRLEPGSKGRSLIVISAYSVSVFPGIAWLNGSLYGPVFTSYLPIGPMRDMATEQMWFQVIGVPWLLFSVVFLAVIYFLLKPQDKLSVTKAQLELMYDDLGPLSKREKGCLAAFAFFIICLVLQTMLPVTINQTLLAALILLLFLNVLSVKDISTGIGWDIVLFFGIALSISQIFEVSGITAWLSPILTSMLAPVAFSPLVFVLALYGICLVLRFFDVAQGWISSAILAVATPMLYSDFGLNPLISLMAFLCGANLFFFRYHQPWLGQVEAVCGEKGWNPGHLKVASLAYAVLAAVMLVFSRFYWGLIGVL